MKNFFKIILSVLLTVSFLFPVKAADFAILNGFSYAVVTEIVDGEAFIANLTPSGQPIMIRMIGVDSEGFDDAVKYLNNILLGSTVRLEIDSNYRSLAGRWNLAYVYKDRLFINSEILQTGNARLNVYHNKATLYSSLKRAEDSARYNALGVWKDYVENAYYYSGDASVNINSATSSQLASRLNISGSLANRIVSYRDNNPFNTIQEIKFITGFTKKMFDDNKNRMVVCTNINSASENELITLIGITDSEARGIVEYRYNRRFNNISQLYSQSLISRSKFNNNEAFISTSDVSNIKVTVPDDNIVNINTATSSQLTKAGFTSSQAREILEYRKEYSYKTIEELSKIFTFNKSDIDKISDNVTVITNINTAVSSEIQSLLGSDSTSALIKKIEDARPYKSVTELKPILSDTLYKNVSPYACIDDSYIEYININTASKNELLSIGITDVVSTNIINKQLSIKTSKDLPKGLINHDSKISLYTNINKASHKELLSLGSSMTSNIANQIINYRNEQPFGDLDEVSEFFSTLSMSSLYSKIKDFIVVR